MPLQWRILVFYVILDTESRHHITQTSHNKKVCGLFYSLQQRENVLLSTFSQPLQACHHRSTTWC